MLKTVQKADKERSRFRSRSSLQARRRQATGSVIAEGVMGIFLVSVGIIAGTALIADATLCMFYKNKVSYAANIAAMRWARVRTGWADSRLPEDAVDNEKAQIISMVSDRLKTLGMPAAKNITLTETRLPRRGVNTVSVAVTVDNLSLIGLGNIVPSQLSLTEKATAILPNKQPPSDSRQVVRIKDGENFAGEIAGYGVYVAGQTDPSKGPTNGAHGGTANFRRFRLPYSSVHFHWLPSQVYGGRDISAGEQIIHDYWDNYTPSEPSGDHPLG